MSPILSIISSGHYTTIQDEGRIGYLSKGVPKSGFLDEVSAAKANLLVGNRVDAPCLECIASGLVCKFLDYAAIGWYGARVDSSINDVAQAGNFSAFVAPGDVLSISKPKKGNITYLAVRGGFHGEKILGSASTFLKAKWGGIHGRRLLPGDMLFSARISNLSHPHQFEPDDGVFDKKVRIIKGPECLMTDWRQLLTSDWKISSQSDRTGLRMQGKNLPLFQDHEMLSSPLDIGTIQLPPDGKPIVLLNDGAATGGYPRIASVIKADLPVLVQKPINAVLRFQEVDLNKAIELCQHVKNSINTRD